jgi:hypothetical protein
MDDRDPVPAPVPDVEQKKPFEPPILRVYGDISTLTRTVGKTGLLDGGGGKTQRTRP